MSETTKTTPAEKAVSFGENGIMRKAWISGRLVFSFFDGGKLTFDKRLATQTNRAYAEDHGWEARLGDKGAVLVAEFPNRSARAAEARRRIGELIDHYQSSTDQWEIPSTRTSGPSKADVLEALRRVFSAMAILKPDQAEKALTIANDPEGFLAQYAVKRNVEESAALKMVAEGQEMSKALLDIRAERAIAANANRPANAAALLEEMMG